MTKLAPQVVAMLQILRDLPVDKRPIAQLTPAEARARTRAVWVDYLNAAPPWVAEVRDATIATAHGPVPVRLFDPGTDGQGPILFIHGGGFVVGDLDTHQGIPRRLALYAGRPVVSIDYRRAPEHPYPAALEDCVAVAARLAAGDAGLGLLGGPYGIAGDSAGAHLALASALRLRDAGGPLPAGALLFFGCYDPAMTGASFAAFGGGDYMLSSADMRWFWDQYLGGRAEATAAADLLAQDLAGLPPLFVGAAECDPLRDDSLALAARLAAIGADHVLRVWPGMIHGCIGMGRHVNQAEHQLAEAAIWLTHHLPSPDRAR